MDEEGEKKMEREEKEERIEKVKFISERSKQSGSTVNKQVNRGTRPSSRAKTQNCSSSYCVCASWWNRPC